MIQKNKTTQREVAKKTGVSVSSLQKWAKDEGLDWQNEEAVKRRAAVTCRPNAYLTRSEERIVWSKSDYNRELKSFPDWSILWKREQQNRRQKFTKYWYYRETLALYKRENKAFFDWACLWSRYKENKKRKEEYHLMSPQEKRKWNRKAYKYNKASLDRDPKKRLKINSRRRKMMRENPAFRLRDSLRTRLRKFTIGKKSRGISQLIGCTYPEFVAHIEKQFRQGMTWDNYGSKWHLDHIIPCAAFDHSDPKQVKACWHWTNIQPLTAMENCQKQDKITEPQMSLRLNK